MYVRPQVKGKPVDFGVSGKLWRDSLVMFDRNTRSLWSQLLGKAVAGPLAGTGLAELPAEVTTWAEWKRRHPDTLVLAKPPEESVEDIRRRGSVYEGYHRDAGKIGVRGTQNPDPRLAGKTLVFGMRRGERTAAAPFPLLERHPVLNTQAFGVPVVIFSPRGENAAMAYDRRVDGKVLRFEQVPAKGERLVARDLESGSTWSWETGECLQGAFAGRSLQRITGLPVYWGVWAQFHPKTELVEGPAHN